MDSVTKNTIYLHGGHMAPTVPVDKYQQYDHKSPPKAMAPPGVRTNTTATLPKDRRRETIAIANPAIDILMEAVHNLPRELFDTIICLVFEPSTDFTPVTKSYKFPPQLSVNKTTRAIFARRYFGTTFRFHDPDLLCKWLSALQPGHRALLSRVEQLVLCAHISPMDASSPVFDDMSLRMMHKLWDASVRKCAILVVSRAGDTEDVADDCFTLRLEPGGERSYRLGQYLIANTEYDDHECPAWEHDEGDAVRCFAQVPEDDKLDG